MPTAPPPPLLAIPLYPIPIEPPPFFSRPCQFGCSAWPGELGPLPLFACETKPLRRKREEAESFTWYQPRVDMAASAFPLQAPLLAERCWCDPSTPFSPSVPLTHPCNPFFSVLLSRSHPINARYSQRAPFESVWHVKGFRMSDFSWHNLCRQRWDSSGFCWAVGHLFEEEIAFQHISLIRIMWYCSIRCEVPCCWETRGKPAWHHPHMNHVGHSGFGVPCFGVLLNSGET